MPKVSIPSASASFGESGNKSRAISSPYISLENMPTIWITYAWDDNTQCDVDFVAQELVRVGVQVKLGNWKVRANGRLWEQIEHFIQEEKGSDAWLIYATQNSLGSEACKEEFSYALDLALDRRGNNFPIIALFPGPVDNSLISVGDRIRLNVSLTDLEWKERVKAVAEERVPFLARPQLEPFAIQVHRDRYTAGHWLAIEVRPREGTWSPFFAAIPLSEKDRVQPHIMYGPRGLVPEGGALSDTGEAPSSNDTWWVMYAQNEATPMQSYYIHCIELPSRLAFGVNGGRPQFTVADLPLYALQTF
ncbi:MAG: toll/interleukin-1 receptor domain-containing protein [Nitrospirota bacterium]